MAAASLTGLVRLPLSPPLALTRTSRAPALACAPLDADTLDDVMDTLDSLRDGGRVVGVVSHVAEMRDRIPTQLRVTKSRRGSTLAVVR